MNIETKRFQFKARAADGGIVEAIVSAFGNVDYANEVVDVGAFDECVASGNLPKILWSHDWNMPIGKTIEWRILESGDPLLPAAIRASGGLYCKGQLLLNTTNGKDAWEYLANEVIDEFSIGYEVEADEWVDGVRHLKKIRVYEWSPVLMGANPETYLLSAKKLQTMDIETKSTNIRTLLDGLVGQVRIHLDLREKAGRPINAVRWGQLNALAEQLHNASKEMRGLLAETDPSKYAGKHIDPRLYLKMKQLKGLC